jgi:hypothetical protein
VVEISEETADGRLALKTEVFLPRSDDLMRATFRVRLDVRGDVPIRHAALFQLGADYYNANRSDTVAFGHLGELVAEHSPVLDPSQTAVEPVAMPSHDSWMTLYGNLPSAEAVEGFATRALIVRDYNARLGGEPVDKVWFSARTTAFPKHPALAGELVCPPDLTVLKAGDHIDLTAELVIFPASSDFYYGANPALTEILASHADSWHPAAWEAKTNRPSIELPDGTVRRTLPLTISIAEVTPEGFLLHGGSGLVPVIVTGLSAPTEWSFEEKTGGTWQPLGKRFPEEAHPQVDYNPNSRDWSATLSLRAGDASGPGDFRHIRATTFRPDSASCASETPGLCL